MWIFNWPHCLFSEMEYSLFTSGFFGWFVNGWDSCVLRFIGLASCLGSRIFGWFALESRTVCSQSTAARIFTLKNSKIGLILVQKLFRSHENMFDSFLMGKIGKNHGTPIQRIHFTNFEGSAISSLNIISWTPRKSPQTTLKPIPNSTDSSQFPRDTVIDCIRKTPSRKLN